MFYDDGYGLGHFPFFQHVIESISNDYSIYLLLWKWEIKVENLNVNVIKIPDKNNKKISDIKRLNFIQKTLIEIKPKIFLIDFFPFGRFWNLEEINTIIYSVKKQWWKNISIMRDIYLWTRLLNKSNLWTFMTYVSKASSFNIDILLIKKYRILFDLVFKSNIHHIFLCQIFLEYYLKEWILDWILIFWDDNILDIRNEFILSEELKDKFYFPWYIPVKEKNTHIGKWENNKILVSTWWWLTSEEDFYKLISFLSKQKKFMITVLLWPYVQDTFIHKIKQLVFWNENILIKAFTNSIQSYIDDSSYFFWYWWYGTFQHLYEYEWRAFIMSNYDLKDFRHRYYEQKYRTISLSPYLNVEYLDDFTEYNLNKCLNMKLITKSRNEKNINFSNPSKILKLLERI